MRKSTARTFFAKSLLKAQPVILCDMLKGKQQSMKIVAKKIVKSVPMQPKGEPMNHVDLLSKTGSKAINKKKELKNRCNLWKKMFNPHLVRWRDIHAKGRQQAIKLVGKNLSATINSKLVSTVHCTLFRNGLGSVVESLGTVHRN